MSRQEDVLLSVITVTYRDPVGLHATCESLRPLSGMGIRWEQVIVDSSPELNQDAVREFGALWPIRHLALPAEGIYPAMNDGMRGATGEFAWYLNGGDRLKSPELLKQMLDRFRNQPAIDLLCAGADLTRGGRALYPRVPKPDFLENLTAENLLVHPAMIYRRSAWARVGPYTPKFRLAADYEHHLRCFLAQLRAECVSEPLIEFDMSGTSTRIDQAIRERREILQSLAPKISPEIRTRFEVGLRRETRRLRVIQGFGPFKAILRPLWVAMKRRGRSQSGQSVTPILGVPISNLGMEEALSACLERANQRKGGYACFSNVHTVTESLSNLGLRRSLSAASFAFADGLPLVWVSRLKRAAVHSRVCGPDFMREFLRRAAALEQGFIGGSPGQAEAI
ncbi:MAG: WecB/TagA/CpsF family glycosyltransferase, partial [Bdellovibrionota bacterium]